MYADFQLYNGMCAMSPPVTSMRRGVQGIRSALICRQTEPWERPRGSCDNWGNGMLVWWTMHMTFKHQRLCLIYTRYFAVRLYTCTNQSNAVSYVHAPCTSISLHVVCETAYQFAITWIYIDHLIFLGEHALCSLTLRQTSKNYYFGVQEWLDMHQFCISYRCTHAEERKKSKNKNENWELNNNSQLFAQCGCRYKITWYITWVWVKDGITNGSRNNSLHCTN